MGEKLGGYELLEKVGQGGMGAVFRAKQLSMDRIVALKILPKSLAQNPKLKERFLREARVCATLNHLNLINAIDCGEAGGYMYFAMEFVDGQTAKQMLKTREKGRIPLYECLPIIRQIGAALAYAHSKNLVHRDVKPENIMLPKDGEAKLCDLGLARSTLQKEDDASLTQQGEAVGTPYYISPEQARGDEVDRRTDIYSLGATFYYLISGRPLFEGPTSASIMAKHLVETATRVDDFTSFASEDYNHILSKMMAKAPADRYATIEEFIKDLDAVEAGQPFSAANFKAASSLARPVAKKKLGDTQQNPRVPQTGRHAKTSEKREVREKPPARNEGVPVGVWIGAGVTALAVVALLAMGVGGGTKPPIVAKNDAVKQPEPKAAPPIPAPVPAPAAPAKPAPPTPVKDEPKSLPAPAAPVAPPVEQPVAPKPPEVVEKPVAPPPAPAPAPAPAAPVAPVAPAVDLAQQSAHQSFLLEMLKLTAKAELGKVIKELRDLAGKPPYLPAKDAIALDLKDVELAQKFEQSVLAAIGKAKRDIDLPPEHNLRKLGGARVKVEEYNAQGLFVEISGARMLLPSASLPPAMLVEISGITGHDAEAVELYIVRADFDSARKLLPALSDEQRARVEAKLAMLEAARIEVAALAAFKSLSGLAASKDWKSFQEKHTAFNIAFAETVVAKQNADELKKWTAAAEAALTPQIADLFHAKSAKVLPDGFYELHYDFSTPEQLQDFACEHGKLEVANGAMKVPPGGDEWAQARFIASIGELRRFEGIGKVLGKRSRFGIYFLGAGELTGESAPRCILRPYNKMAHIENFEGPYCDCRSGSCTATGPEPMDWSQDIAFVVDGAPGHLLKWTLNGKELGKAKLPDKYIGGNLAFIGNSGDHCWKDLKIVFKPAAAWLATARPAQAKPK